MFCVSYHLFSLLLYNRWLIIFGANCCSVNNLVTSPESKTDTPSYESEEWSSQYVERRSLKKKSGLQPVSRRSRVRIPLKPWFFFSGFFLPLQLKLENLLRWSFFTFIYYRSSNINYFIYNSHQHIISLFIYIIMSTAYVFHMQYP